MLKFCYWLLIVLVGCCGYSTRSTLPSQFRSIAIPVVNNQTVKPGLGDLLTNRLIDDYTKDRSLKIVQIDRADIVLECRITNYERSPQSYNANQEVSVYRTTISVFVRAIDKTKSEAEPLVDSEISTYITYEPQQNQTEDDGIDKVIAKISQEIIRKTLTAW